MEILLFNFLGFDTKTVVTDTLSAIGLGLIILCPLIFNRFHRIVLNQRLHTVVDGNKLFEKLKYDLKIKGNLKGIERVRLYKNIHYARTIFRGAMEYNEREFTWYFNEKYAKERINNLISKNSFYIFLSWMLFLVTIFAGTKLDIIHWLFEMKKMNNVSGIVSIWVLFIFFLIIHALFKTIEYFSVRRVINDDIRKINLKKKELVFADFKIVFWTSISIEILGFFFILLNIFF